MRRHPPHRERSPKWRGTLLLMRAALPQAAALMLAAALMPAVVLMLAAAPAPAAQALESLDAFPRSPLEIRTQSGSQRYDVWIADTPARSQQGLMFVKALHAGQGMLFPLQRPGVMRMWMKDTLIPLDMLFIDAHGQIIYIRHDATPQSEAIITTPAPVVTPVKAVLELAGGECARRHIEQGDWVINGFFY
jgi:uncharacterized membrane protein (UPF0127 family)